MGRKVEVRESQKSVEELRLETRSELDIFGTSNTMRTAQVSIGHVSSVADLSKGSYVGGVSSQ